MKIRVLIADDHAIMREGLHALLAAAPDITVVGEVENGREAVERTRETMPDVIVMDISMPGLNGIEAARLIHDKFPNTRIVLLSMYSSSEHVHRGLAAGAMGYIMKESAGAEVITAVRSVAQGRRYLSATIAENFREYPPDGAGPGPLDRLSTRERQVLQLVVEGRSSVEIGQLVHLSPKTVDTYRSRLMKKLAVADVPALVKFALQHGLTPPQ